MKQYEAVIEVMKQNGGYATLGYLNQHVLKIPGCKWGTKTPFASIRRIVQTYPDFFKIRPGLWALSAERERVLKKLALSEATPTAQAEEFAHSYYQGLLLEVGNLLGFETFVPRQDKNKPFLGRRLGDVSKLDQYYEFTYDHLIRRSRTIDVTWFNQRRLPKAFFEVEHSTDIQTSLLKFSEFQDFRVEFWIVADSVRCGEFKDKLSLNAFAPIRAAVKFMNYEDLADLHTKVFASAAVQQAVGL